jgi:hypothetical protein
MNPKKEKRGVNTLLFVTTHLQLFFIPKRKLLTMLMYITRYGIEGAACATTPTAGGIANCVLAKIGKKSKLCF